MAEYSPAKPAVGKLSGFARHMGGGLDPRSGEPVFLPRLGLQIPRKLPYQRWLALGRELSGLFTSSAWCLGDWLAYGEKAFGGRYREAIEQTSLDYQTLRNYAWVAKRFPLSRRRDTLSFGHHTEVAALPVPEQDFWLRKAEALGWSCKQLRRQLRASVIERARGAQGEAGMRDAQGEVRGAMDKEDPPPPRAQLRIELSPDQIEICRTAAEEIGLDLHEWVVLALEQAARHGLAVNSAHALALSS